MVFLVLAIPAAAHADGWLTAEAPAAVAVSDAQQGVFRAGAMPAIGLYTDEGPLALGVRLRAGVLRNGSAPGNNLMDPGTGGLGEAGLAVRVPLHGAWTEVVIGGGITGHDVVPTVEAGVGWSFAVGSVNVGPSARYVRVISTTASDAFGSADLVLAGFDVQIGHHKASRRAVERVDAAPVVVDETPPPAPRDGDTIPDSDLGCTADGEGCESPTPIEVKNDRIVLDDRVLFDTDRAHVHTAGRVLIRRIAKMWNEHPEWVRITVEGHTDVRGGDAYNQELSAARAERVREQFLRLGFEASRIDAVGFGRSRLIDEGTSPEAHQRNRRVEFVIDRGGSR